MRTIKKIEKEIETVICDRCNSATGRAKKCLLCGRDVCWNCSVLTENVTYSFSDHAGFDSDYPEHICKQCWTDIKPLRLEYAVKIREAKDALESLEAEFTMKAQGVVN